MELPREEVYGRILAAIELGVELGADSRGAGRVYGGRRRRRHHDRRALADSGDDRQLAHDRRGRFKVSSAVRARWRSTWPRSTAVVVGATGSIGGACVQLIAPRVKHVMLVARNETRLRKFHEQIAGDLPCESSYTTDISAAVRRAQLVLPRPRRRKTSFRPEDLQTGAVVCELSLPHDVSRRVALERPDVLVTEGGNMVVPGNPRFERVREPGNDFDLNLPPRTALACMSETMVLALEGRIEPFTLGRGIDLQQSPRDRSDGGTLRLHARRHARLRRRDHAGKNRRHRGTPPRSSAQRSHRVKKSRFRSRWARRRRDHQRAGESARRRVRYLARRNGRQTRRRDREGARTRRTRRCDRAWRHRRLSLRRQASLRVARRVAAARSGEGHAGRRRQRPEEYARTRSGALHARRAGDRPARANTS